MKKINSLSYLFIALLIVIVWNCDDNSSSTGPEMPPNNEVPPNGEIVEASEERQFVWEAMNFWYFYQEEVPELADDKSNFSGEQDFQDFLMSFNSTQDLFNALLFDDDEFSFFIENFEEFDSGDFISETMDTQPGFGFNFGLVQFNNAGDILGYVQFVQSGSPADSAGLKRGDLFRGVSGQNGPRLNTNNFQSELNQTSFNLVMADIDSSGLSETGEIIPLQQAPLEDNPVFLSKVLDVGSSKVGYLVYNSFQTSSHEELNNIFGDFNSQGVDEIILDLRYNGGGALITSAVLASMASGLGPPDIFAQLTFNEKRSAQNDSVTFLDQVPIFNEDGQRQSEMPMNKLSINRIFVLTGFQTASASEALINGLLPFKEVVLVGEETVGKDEGSIMLFDSPPTFTNRENANPNHKVALQPIVFKDVNANGEGFPTDNDPDPSDGFVSDNPENQIREIDFLEDLPPLGDENEPLLARALEIIGTGSMMMARTPSNNFNSRLQMLSTDLQIKRGSQGMYLLPGEVQNMLKIREFRKNGNEQGN